MPFALPCRRTLLQALHRTLSPPPAPQALRQLGLLLLLLASLAPLRLLAAGELIWLDSVSENSRGAPADARTLQARALSARFTRHWQTLATGTPLRRLTLDHYPHDSALHAALANAALVVTLDDTAADAVLASGNSRPHLHLLASRHAQMRREQRWPAARQMHLLWGSAAPDDALLLARALQSDAPVIGVLFGPDSVSSKPDWLTAARRQGLQMHHRLVHPGEPAARLLKHLRPAISLFLLLPDAQLWPETDGATGNPRALFLRESLAARLPVIGFDRQSLQAGAIAALYPQPEEQMARAAQFAAELLAAESSSTKAQSNSRRPATVRREPAHPLHLQLNEAVLRKLSLHFDAASLPAHLILDKE